MGIEKRLQLIMVSNQLNATSFADKIGVQRSNLSHILNGRNKPGYDFLLKVVQAFPKVSTHWLLTGEEQGQTNTEAIEAREEKKAEAASMENNIPLNNKTIIKTVIFYNDFTFDVFLPNAQ